jgi:hypothetical protein
VTVREDREVAAPAPLALAAIGTAGENLGYTVRDVRPDDGLLLMTSPMTLRGISLGYVVTVHVRALDRGSQLSVDVTPRLGSWAASSAQDALDELIQELQTVLAAPKARVRRPDVDENEAAPFGYRPPVLAAAWAFSSVAFYGLLVGGWGWIPAGAALAGALLHAEPSTARWWTVAAVALAVVSLPFGAMGELARRLARANLFWQAAAEP